MKNRVLIILSLLLACNANALPESLDRIIATANNKVITQSELENYKHMVVAQLPEGITLPPAHIFNNQVLDKMIQNIIQKQLAEQSSIVIDVQTLDQTIRDLAEGQGNTVEQFKQEIEKRGLSYKHFRRNIHDELIIQRLQQQEIMPRLSISEQELENFLSSPIGQEQLGTKYQLSHILLTIPEDISSVELDAVKANSLAVIDKLKNGANFSTLALELSQGQRSLQGGDLGWREMAQIPTIFSQQVVGMNVGDIIGPIQSNSGFHIVKLVARKTNDAATQNVVEYNIRHILIKVGEHKSDEQAKKQLLSIQKQIVEGKKEFAELAKQHSNELSSAANGGNIGWVAKNVLVAEFYNVVKSSKESMISEPFKSSLGWHILEVQGKRDAQNSSDLANRQALMSLREQKYHEMVELWLQQVHERAQVKKFF